MNTFSSMNILNYTSVSSDSFPASLGSNSFNSSENSKDNMIPPVFSPFYNNPCLKDVQAFYAKELPISSPDPITPTAIVPPSMSDSRDFFPPKEISSPEGAKTPVKSPNPMSTSSSVGSSSPVRSTTSPPNYLFNESIFAELDNSLWIISRPLGSKPVPKEFNIHHWK
ncbi:hypothetical protein Tco_1020433 [Tanacetum coccineum]